MSPSPQQTIPHLSVILPCYNESRGLRATLDGYEKAGQGINFELILVNNGSRDDTAAALETLLPAYPFARCVTIEQNRGYGHGIITGLQAALAPVLAWSHADLQTDPADVFRALELFQQHRAGERILIKGRRFGRSPGERVISWGMQLCATLILSTPFSEINAQPKLFDRSLLAHLGDPPKDFNFDLYVLFQARRNGWKMVSFPVQFPPRLYGESNWASTWQSKLRTIARSLRYMVRLGWGL